MKILGVEKRKGKKAKGLSRRRLKFKSRHEEYILAAGGQPGCDPNEMGVGPFIEGLGANARKRGPQTRKDPDRHEGGHLPHTRIIKMSITSVN